eukprot:9473242-Pyramimonas_sp.AAC.1
MSTRESGQERGLQSDWLEGGQPALHPYGGAIARTVVRSDSCRLVFDKLHQRIPKSVDGLICV